MRTTRWTALLATIAVVGASTGLSLAQQGPGRPGFGGQQGGPGQFRGGGMQMGPQGPGILRMPEVQKELGLSEDQIEKLNKIIPGPPMGGRGGPGQGGGSGFQGGPPQGGFQGGPPQGGGGFQGGPPQGQGGFQGGPPQGAGFQGGPGGRNPEQEQKQREEIEKKIKGVLTDEQFTRYQQLALQLEGAKALSRPEVADKVGLSNTQVEKIRKIVQEMDDSRRGPGGLGGGWQERPIGRGGNGGPPQGGGGFQGGPPQGGGGFQGGPPPGGQQGGRPPMGGPGMMSEEDKKKMDAKILAVLTDAQKSKWTAMLGKPFKFPNPRPPRREED